MKTKTILSYFFFLVTFLVMAQNQPYPTPGLLPGYAPSPECSADGNKYYVGNGDVNGDGSFTNPFNSIQVALDKAEPGDVIYIKPGKYYIDNRLRLNKPGTKDKRIWIKAYDYNHKPLLKRTGDINRNGVYDYGTKFNINGKMYYEYGGEILLARSPYYVIDGIIFDGNFALSNYAFKYIMGKNIPNEKAYQNVVVVPHYGGVPFTGTDYPMQLYMKQNGDHTIIRNCDIGNNLYDGLYICADSVLVENTEIHHNLRGNFDDPVDAHAIAACHMNYLRIIHCDLHHNSGDCVQVDYDIHNTHKSKLWDNVFVEHTKLWTGELEQDCGGFKMGESPGENGVDTKTFEDEPLTHRPKITLKNILAHGFTMNGYMNRRCPFNIKYNVDWVIDGVTAYNNELAFRIRGPYENIQGGAHITIKNAVVFNNRMAFRFERYVEQLQILNSTFANNIRYAEHAATPTHPSYDVATYICLNNLYLGTKPADAPDPSNISVTQAAFVNVSENNFQLVSGSSAIDRGVFIEGVTTDRNGTARPFGSGFDVGAYEFIAPASGAILAKTDSDLSTNSLSSDTEELALNQNWPNPFNPTTSISFSIAKPSLVTLKVYDVLGSEVAELVNGFKEKGNYNISFNGSKLASGIYFYKLTSGNQTFIKKMLLMK